MFFNSLNKDNLLLKPRYSTQYLESKKTQSHSWVSKVTIGVLICINSWNLLLIIILIDALTRAIGLGTVQCRTWDFTSNGNHTQVMVKDYGLT